MRRLPLLLVRLLPAATLALAVAAPACVQGRMCTELGCGVGARLVVRAPGNTWPAGIYAVEAVVDGARQSCTFVMPAAAAGVTAGAAGAAVPDAGASFTCSGLDGRIAPEVTCRERRTGDAVTHTCTPVPGQHRFEATFAGTPRALELRVTHEDAELAAEAWTPAYEETRPNGPDCEPVCRSARREIGLSW